MPLTITFHKRKGAERTVKNRCRTCDLRLTGAEVEVSGFPSRMGWHSVFFCEECADLAFGSDVRLVFAKVHELHRTNARHRRGFRIGEVGPTTPCAHMVSEAAEVLDTLTFNRPREETVKEMGDVLGCLVHVMYLKNITLEEVATACLKKLDERFSADSAGSDSINREMDELAIRNGLGYWRCISLPDDNSKWRRTDGVIVTVPPAGDWAVCLAEYDRLNPLPSYPAGRSGPHDADKQDDEVRWRGLDSPPPAKAHPRHPNDADKRAGS